MANCARHRSYRRMDNTMDLNIHHEEIEEILEPEYRERPAPLSERKMTVNERSFLCLSAASLVGGAPGSLLTLAYPTRVMGVGHMECSSAFAMCVGWCCILWSSGVFVWQGKNTHERNLEALDQLKIIGPGAAILALVLSAVLGKGLIMPFVGLAVFVLTAGLWFSTTGELYSARRKLADELDLAEFSRRINADWNINKDIMSTLFGALMLSYGFSLACALAAVVLPAIEIRICLAVFGLFLGGFVTTAFLHIAQTPSSVTKYQFDFREEDEEECLDPLDDHEEYARQLSSIWESETRQSKRQQSSTIRKHNAN